MESTMELGAAGEPQELGEELMGVEEEWALVPVAGL